MLADKPTELSKIKLKTWTRQPVPMISEHSAHLTPLSVDFRTWLWRYTYLLLLISYSGAGKRYSNRKETSCVPLQNAGLEPRVPDIKSPADWMHPDKPTELLRIKLKTWTRQLVPVISEHSAHLTPMSVDFRTWLWLYTYLLLLISMLWHMQAIFKSKGDKLCSSAECRLWSRGPRHQIASRIERRQVVFLCRMQDWNPGSQTPNRQQT